jgi:hypothetical protein
MPSIVGVTLRLRPGLPPRSPDGPAPAGNAQSVDRRLSNEAGVGRWGGASGAWPVMAWFT